MTGSTGLKYCVTVDHAADCNAACYCSEQTTHATARKVGCASSCLLACHVRLLYRGANLPRYCDSEADVFLRRDRCRNRHTDAWNNGSEN